MGYTEAQAVSLNKLSQAAIDTATKTRSFSQLLDNLKDDASTAWAHVFQAIIGNLTQATAEFTKLSSVAQNIFLAPVNDLAAMIEVFNSFGGRVILIQAMSNAFHELGAIIGIVKSAFSEVFGSSGQSNGFGFTLALIAGGLLHLTDALQLTKRGAEDLKTIFAGLFSAVKIVIDVIAAMYGGLTNIKSSASGAGSGLLGFLDTIAKYVIALRKAIESGTALQTFFDTLGKIISIPVKALGLIIGALGGFAGATASAVSGASSFVSKVATEFSKLGSAIINGIKSGNLSNVGTLINQILLGGVLVQIKKFISGFGESSGSGGGLLDTIKESFEGLTNSLKALQQNLKADTLQKIAIAVALLTASLVALSFVNVGNLTKALTTMTIMFTELLGALAVVSKIAGSSGVVKMTVIGVALNLLATSILILTGAVAILAHFSWDQLTKGLAAIAILLAELSVAILLMSNNAKGVATASFAMEKMAIAMNIMAEAVERLGALPLDVLAKGVVTIAALLLLLTTFQNLSGGQKLISSAVGMVLIGAALNVMASAIAKLGSLSLGTLVKGITAVAAVLLVLIVAMEAMEGALPGAAALVIAAAGLLILSKALGNLGSESWGAIGKALVALAGSLVIIIAAMALMSGALPGAAALIVVSAALYLLSGVLVVLGGLSWDTLIHGLVGLAAIFAVIGVAGLLLTPIVPALIGLGAAIALIGIGVAAAGAGVLLFGLGLTALSVAVVAAGAAALAFVKVLGGIGPAFVTSLLNGVASVAKAVGAATTAIVQAFLSIFNVVLTAIIALAPKFAKAVDVLVTAIIQIINTDVPKVVNAFLSCILDILTKVATYFPRFVATGIQIITNTINGIASKIPGVAAAAVNLITTFISAITTSAVKVTAAAITMTVNMINGIANTIRAQSPAIQGAMHNLGAAMITGITAAVVGLAGSLASALVDAVKGAVNAAKNWLLSQSPSKKTRDEIGVPIIQGIVLGIANSGGDVSDAMVNVVSVAVQNLRDNLSGISQLVSDNMDLQPKITPVVDLTQAKKGFSDLSALTKDQLINAGTSSSSAASISAANAAAAQQAGLITGVGASLQFTQNNYSPVALSAAEIYRKTKSQISIAKGVLAGNANAG